MRKWLSVSLICIATIVGWIFVRPSVQSRTAVDIAPTAPLTAKPRPTTTPSSSNERTTSEKPRTKPTLLNQLPKQDVIREQAAQDPHAPPPAGAAFAIELADRIDEAIVSEEASFQLLSELDVCAANREPGTVVASVQALCLHAARTLAKAHPRLARDVEGIFDRAEPETAALTRALED